MERFTKEETMRLVKWIVPGRRGGGFHYVPELDMSVQAQNANVSWRATYTVLKRPKIPAEIDFSWQKGDPSAAAKIIVEWNE
jgi:hypothetical protein